MKIVIKGRDEVIAVRLMFYAIASVEGQINVTNSIFVAEARKICLNFMIKTDLKSLKLTPMMIVMIDYYYDYLCKYLPLFEKNILLNLMSQMHSQCTNAVINQNLLTNGN